MSKYLDLLIDFSSYDSTSPSNNPADGDRIKRSISEKSVSALTRFNPLAVPNATSDMSVPLPSGTSNYLLICTDQTVSVKINGSGTVQTLRPTLPGVKTPVLILRGDITSLSVSNSSGEDANLDVIVAKV